MATRPGGPAFTASPQASTRFRGADDAAEAAKLETRACATIKDWQHCLSKRYGRLPQPQDIRLVPGSASQGQRNNQRISQVAGGPMNDRLEFDTVCPNNHNQTVTFSQKEFEESLKSDTLVFHCNTCDTNWPPSSEEIAKLRKHFSKDSS